MPLVLYVVSFLTYEASSFLIFVVPMLVCPLYSRSVGRLVDNDFMIKLSLGILSGFAVSIAIRFLFLKGGAVGHSFLFPPIELFLSYIALLPFYLLAPFTSPSADRWSVLAGFLVLLAAAGTLYLANRFNYVAGQVNETRPHSRSRWRLVLLGGSIFALGMLPYQLAGYGGYPPSIAETLQTKCGLLSVGDLSWFNFSWASRIYSSASSGVAIMLAVGLCGWKKLWARNLGRFAALLFIGFMAVFHTGLSQDWREASEIQNDLFGSMLSQVPAVKPSTNFVFLDIASSHKRAEVVRKENGLRELVQMLYGDQTVNAWRLYSHEYDPYTRKLRQAVASPEGFVCASGQRQYEPSPNDSLLLFKRSGRALVLLNKIEASDGTVPTGIVWRGVDRLTSNPERIENSQALASVKARMSRKAWQTGLISSVQLTRFKRTQAYFSDYGHSGHGYSAIFSLGKKAVSESIFP